MNIIHIILLVGIWLITIKNGLTYINFRDMHIRSGATKKSQELMSAQKAFIRSLICAIIYTLIKLF